VLKKRLWRDYVENILIAIFLALFVRSFILTGYRVPTETMAPTLIPGDFVFAFRLPFGMRVPLTQTKWVISSPRRGDVVVFSFPNESRTLFVRRVIGLPGDRVEMRDGFLVVNDKPLLTKALAANENGVFQELIDEREHLVQYPDSGSKPQMATVIVPPDQVFVMSDRREGGDGLRKWGLVPVERIEGRVELIWLSMDWHGIHDPSASTAASLGFRSDRILSWVH